jgi:DNA-binding transcriptional LysR family regulator
MKQKVDLNLLAALDALIAERNVSRAAGRLGLTQSALSHALQRLRAIFDDELLVRSGGAMQPTQAALRIAEALRPALSQIDAILNLRSSFDARTSTRTFVLRASEYVAPFLLAPLCVRLRRAAPGLKLTVLPFQGAPQEQRIEPGELHLRAERASRKMVRPTSRLLFEDDFVVLMARDHAEAGVPLTLEHYVSLPHLKVVADAVGTNMIDDALRRLGLARNVVLTVPSWFEMRRVIASTDLVAAVPRHWAQDKGFAPDCVWHDLPLDQVVLGVELVWHPRDAAEPGNLWLRQVIAEVFAATLGASGPVVSGFGASGPGASGPVAFGPLVSGPGASEGDAG